MKRINTLLVANRGEIAGRIIATARKMGIRTVAVYSDADAGAPFVRAADEAVRLGPPPAAESYLNQQALLDAAARTGADAVHPGYGFLAENAEFAANVAGAGLIFVGPSPEAIALLGSKKASKERVAAADVPVIPSYDSADTTSMSFPVLLKASAGGGGKGMRIVRSADELESALESAKREARGAFGDDTMLIERYVERPRHVEVQILADSHGACVHLFERECSIQRRHQKIVEETPSPALTPELRERMGAAAVAVARAASYENAGTVEFILAPDGEFYFLEVNTRLQVEHPVTEMVTGLDLVREQIRIAEGEELGYTQGDLEQRGSAVEVRLYAENADGGFLPQTGTLADFHLPALEGLRVDSGVEAGSEIGIHYDPMLAKIIAHAATRTDALRILLRALEGLSAPGVITNRDFLRRVLAHPAFVAGEMSTHFLDEHSADLVAPELPPATRDGALAMLTAWAFRRRAEERALLPAMRPGYRNNPSQGQQDRYRLGESEHEVSYRAKSRALLELSVDGSQASSVVVIDASEHGVTVEMNGHRRSGRIVRRGETFWIVTGGETLEVSRVPRFPDGTEATVAGGCLAPMPGKIVRVAASEGDSVSAGATLVVLEAMKMEHTVTTEKDGVVTQVCVAEGDQVEADQLLVVVGEPDS